MDTQINLARIVEMICSEDPQTRLDGLRIYESNLLFEDDKVLFKLLMEREKGKRDLS